jgi:uncharacterized protein (TIGR03437 family)
MYKFSANKILLAASALLLCAGIGQAQTTEPASPASASPTSVTVQYTLGTGPGNPVTVTFVDAGKLTGTYGYSVDPSTVPYWLTVTPDGNPIVVSTSGTLATATFNSNANAANLTPGVYTYNVHVRVTGFQDLVLPVSLAVAGSASSLTVKYNTTTETGNPATAIALNWQYGAAVPAVSLNLLSSDAPLAFTVTTAITTPTNTVDWIQSPVASAIAYNYGTGLNLTFLSDVFKNANVGDILSGTVTITPSSGSVVVIPINITVTEAAAALGTTPLSPAYVPLQMTGSVKVVVSGSGFYPSTATTPTVVSIKYGVVTTLTDLTSIASADTVPVHGAVTVLNPNTMILTIPWEDVTPVSILNTAQVITISIVNGSIGSAVTTTLTVTTKPIIDTITDAGALVAPAAGVTPNFAPYEMVTIFGANFGATSSVVASPSSGLYPTSLTVATSTSLTVNVYQQDGTTLIAAAPLLFASATQINLMVPSEIISGTTITGLNFIVTVGSNSSQPYVANPVVANPGLFTTSSTGQGQGAILNSDLTVNSDSNLAKPGSTVVLYVTGLGAPNSTAKDVAVTTAAKWPGSCVSVTNYETAASLTSLDGVLLNGSDLLTNTLPPCFATNGQVSVTIGGAAATVTYAGWVSGSITSLYQINATVPTKAAAGDLPVVVNVAVPSGKTTVNVPSQAGVTVAVN